MPSPTMLWVLAALSSTINFVRYRLPFGDKIWSVFDFLSLWFVTLVRLYSGSSCAKGIEKCERPQKPLILYEFEGCPYCRKVRETLSVLAIDHYVYPCPRETLKQAGFCLNSRYRTEVMRLGGALKFPFLIDPNTDKKMFESDDIISYLWTTYGAQASAPLNYRLAHWAPYRDFSMKICSLLRPCTDMGMLRAPSYKPEEPLELWGYEASPCVRRVREVLSRLEAPYMYHEIPYGSDKRPLFRKQHAHEFSQKALRDKLECCQVPFFKDPNTKKQMFESAAIVEYLMKKYETRGVENESWLVYGSEDKKKTQ